MKHFESPKRVGCHFPSVPDRFHLIYWHSLNLRPTLADLTNH
jgi:hypothetical protein